MNKEELKNRKLEILRRLRMSIREDNIGIFLVYPYHDWVVCFERNNNLITFNNNFVRLKDYELDLIAELYRVMKELKEIVLVL